MSSILQQLKEMNTKVDTNITDLQTNLDSLTTNINTNTNNITSNLNLLNSLTSSLSSIQTQQETNTASIADINSLTSSIQTQQDINTVEITGLQDELDSKQNVLTSGDNITIVDNVISSTGGGGNSFVGFRATGDGTFSQTVAFGQTISNKLVVYEAQANSTFDTESGYNSTTGRYIIPVGYTGWWETTLKLYMFGYTEGVAQVGLRQNSTTIITSGNYQGERGDFTTYVYLTEGDEMYIRQEQNSGQYSYATTRSWWQMKFISATL